jgi:hypothetical protein
MVPDKEALKQYDVYHYTDKAEFVQKFLFELWQFIHDVRKSIFFEIIRRLMNPSDSTKPKLKLL